MARKGVFRLSCDWVPCPIFFHIGHSAVCVRVWVWRGYVYVFVPVVVVVEAVGRDSGLGLEGSAEGGWSTEGFPAAPPAAAAAAAGCSPPSPAGHTVPPAETTNHTLVRGGILRSGLRQQQNFYFKLKARESSNLKSSWNDWKIKTKTSHMSLHNLASIHFPIHLFVPQLKGS